MATLQLFIVAVPNGSGESTFSATITDLKGEVFDDDKHLANLRKSFPEIESDTGYQNLYKFYKELIRSR